MLSKLLESGSTLKSTKRLTFGKRLKNWADVRYRSVIVRDTGDVLERERYVRCMPLRVAESTLIRPRNITTTLHFRLRGPEQLRSGNWDERRVARYRRAAAKLNYLALDNPCMAYASKVVSRKMSDPEPSDDKSITRVLRYIKDDTYILFLTRRAAWPLFG